MAKQDIGVGTTANDGTGDNLRAGAQKVNANFAEVYTLLGDGTTLSSDTVTLNTATQTLTNKTLTAPQINSPTITSGNVATSFDMNGTELILDVDADTSITADTDDIIHFKLGGNDRVTFESGLIELRNDGSQSQLRLFCESANAHYVALQAPAHSVYSGNVTVTLPNKTSTLQGSSTETITAAGAVDVDTEVSLLDSTAGAMTITMGTGRFVGQRKIIIMTVDGGNVTMTQSGGNLSSANVPVSLIWEDVGDNATFIWNGNDWNVVGIDLPTLGA
jgi:hypothetical protein